MASITGIIFVSKYQIRKYLFVLYEIEELIRKIFLNLSLNENPIMGQNMGQRLTLLELG